jgi:hypothetical protein
MSHGIVQEKHGWQEHSTKEKSMQGTVYRDATGKKFEVRLVDHTPNGSWVHYHEVGKEQEYSCLVDAFKERFTKVEI